MSKRPYHQKEIGMMKVRYAINIENNMLEEIEDVSQKLELPRSKVTRALLRYGLDNITTKQIYELGKDENLQQPVTQSMDDTTTTGVNTGTNLTDAEAGGLPLKVCKYKDYFTSCLPSPQKSEEPVTIPLSGLYPVELRDVTGQNPQSTIFMNGTGGMAAGNIDGGGGGAATVTGASTSGGMQVKQGNLYVNLAGDLTATGAQATINQLRQQPAKQQHDTRKRKEHQRRRPRRH